MITIQRKPTVLIVGSGRSGTSTVAGICHNDMNICMGHFLKDSDYMNPNGYYEDLVSHGLVRAMTDGSYSGGTYLKLMNGFHKECLAWGAKDPWFLYCPPKTLVNLAPKLAIITIRDIDATVNSWLKIWHKQYAQFPDRNPPQEVIDHYENLTRTRQDKALQISKYWPNTLTFDFTNTLQKEDIISQIRNGLTHATSQ